MPVEVVFTRDETHNDIDIYLTKLFNFRLDFDEILNLLLTTKDNREQVTLSSLKYKFALFKMAKKIIQDIGKNARPKRLKFTIKAKKIQPEIDLFLYIILWTFLSYVKDKFHELVPRMEDDSYNLVYASKFNYTFYWSIRIRLVYIIFSIIINYRDLLKIRKHLRKGKKKYGTSSNL